MKTSLGILAAGIAFLLPLISSGAETGSSDGEVTFSEHIAPIVFDNCMECHRPGEAAPFPLTSFAEVAKRGRMIKRVTKEGYMPPWHPVEGHGEFFKERRLTSEEIGLLSAWVDSGMPEGDPEKTPPAPEFPVDWRLGEPDLVVTMEEGFEVPADGPDIYRQFAIPLSLPDDKWVRAVEVRPSEAGALHHVLIFLDSTGTARRRDAADPRPGFAGMEFRKSGSLGGWAVGAGPKELPKDLAMGLPAGSDIVLSSHFHPTGKKVKEKTKVGLFLADKAPDRRLIGFQLPREFGKKAGIDIRAGERAYTITDSKMLPVDTDLISVGAHMHYLGKSVRATARLPDGTRKELFYIEDWDFNWQDSYRYRKPVRLPAKTWIDVELTWDNSEENPNNPFDPPRRVKWGAQSTDEMGSISFVCVAAHISGHDKLASELGGRFSTLAGGSNIPPKSAVPETSVPEPASSPEGKSLMRRFERADRDGNGVLRGEELPVSYRSGDEMKYLDENKDGKITWEEADAARKHFDDAKRGDFFGIFDRLDIDEDGWLRGGEIPANLRERRIMKVLDKNGDGEIARDELPSPSDGTGG